MNENVSSDATGTEQYLCIAKDASENTKICICTILTTTRLPVGVAFVGSLYPYPLKEAQIHLLDSIVINEELHCV